MAAIQNQKPVSFKEKRDCRTSLSLSKSGVVGKKKIIGKKLLIIITFFYYVSNF
jgi:hypothetical protein